MNLGCSFCMYFNPFLRDGPFICGSPLKQIRSPASIDDPCQDVHNVIHISWENCV